MTKIDFTNRNSRKDKRKKKTFKETIQGDFDLVMDSYFDNSTGDYNHLWGDFINSLGDPNIREKFQKFLQDYIDRTR